MKNCASSVEKKLLIVESPAKAKTIGKYLGPEFIVKSSVGHIRDLPKESGAIAIKEVGSDSWTFEPKYEISDGKTKVVNELKSSLKDVSSVYLASDPDREGEAIAWHLKEVLSSNAKTKPFYRVSYNEITKSAVLKAVAEPRDIDMPRVDAQQARRILDRLVGYKVSPLLWKNINCPNNRSLSAGRVQSVALRLLVERQREIDAFKSEKYFLMGVEARKAGDSKTFVAKLSRIDGEKPQVKSREEANTIILELSDVTLEVTDLKVQPKTRHALPPFTTSTLQQAASSVLGFSPGKTMKLAQSLYEHGHITYMRSDSVNVSEQARASAKAFIEKAFGSEYYPETPNFFKAKASKGGVQAQEAHEAIRPTHVESVPKNLSLDASEMKLYDLIWRRFVASQMADAKTTVSTISIAARKALLKHDYLFTASATTIDFEGFLKVMKLSLKKKKAEEEEDEDGDEVAYLPRVSLAEQLEAVRWLADEKETKGPSHYSEASLIKALEENGVGRPSTYAATIETLKLREYAKTEKKKLIPLERGILVCDWLVKKMDSFFNVGFTADMEAKLDKVEEEGVPMNRMLSDFYKQFLSSLGGTVEPAPDREKFESVFEMLSEVKEWKSPKKVGKRVYDDKAFVESVKEQANSGERPLSARQLEFLVRMVIAYAAQIENAQQRLKEAGLAANSGTVPKADEELCRYCFEIMDRIGGMEANDFMKSLRLQFDRGKGLSMKQFTILAKAVGENAGALEDVDEIHAKLSEFVEGGFTKRNIDTSIRDVIKLFDGVTEWRPAVRKGKRVYDDEIFVKSISEQFTRRGQLSARQAMALKRLALVYRKNIPDFDAKVKAAGISFDGVDLHEAE
ncbi:MAG: type I DNA topoisomerase [Kiritimatiellae bacterium]|nr:type I DNA topoisomerase [Kiritimatiellia bacterium]